jgi:hypothetical protein
MCVICVKPKGKAFPTTEKLLKMYSTNDDGAGFMFMRDNKVKIQKGFMSYKSFRKALRRADLTDDDVVVMHFRIATAGSISPSNTHPFPISSEVKELQSRNIETDLGIAHNGILSCGGDKKEDLSDTQTFIRDVLSSDAIRNSLYEGPTADLIEMAIGSSKMVVLNSDGELAFMGEWKKDDKDITDECWYSNLNWSWTPTKKQYWDSVQGKYVDTKPKRGNIIYLPSKTANKKKKEHLKSYVCVEYHEQECPSCHYPLSTIGEMNCTKCGVFFVWPYDDDRFLREG